MDSKAFQLRARKLISALGSAPTRRALTLGVAPAIEHIQLIRTLRPDSIVDVGANRGQFALAARIAARQARIICFEPGRRAYDVLTRIVGSDSSIRVVCAAIAREPGEIILNITKEDDSSSVLSVGETQARLFGTKVVEQQKVTAGPLEQFVFAGDFGERTLLKIDVQGFERDVLLGSQSRLPSFRWVYVESSFIELYVGQALAPELIHFMDTQGFELAGVFNQVSGANAPAVQADFLFNNRRSPTTLSQLSDHAGS